MHMIKKKTVLNAVIVLAKNHTGPVGAGGPFKSGATVKSQIWVRQCFVKTTSGATEMSKITNRRFESGQQKLNRMHKTEYLKVTLNLRVTKRPFTNMFLYIIKSLRILVASKKLWRLDFQLF